jgi:hypothetical protein
MLEELENFTIFVLYLVHVSCPVHSLMVSVWKILNFYYSIFF